MLAILNLQKLSITDEEFGNDYALGHTNGCTYYCQMPPR